MRVYPADKLFESIHAPYFYNFLTNVLRANCRENKT